MRIIFTLTLLLGLSYPLILYADQPIYSNSLWSALYREFNISPYQTFWNSRIDSTKAPTLETFIIYNNILNTKYKGNKLNLGNTTYGITVNNALIFKNKNYGSLQVTHSNSFSNNKWKFKNPSNSLSYHDDVKNYAVTYKNHIWKTLEIQTTLGFINSSNQNMLYTGFRLGYQWSRVNATVGYDQSNTLQYSEFTYDGTIVYIPIKFRTHSYYFETVWKTNEYMTFFTGGKFHFTKNNPFIKNQYTSVPDIENYNFENRILYQNSIWSSELFTSFSRTPSLAHFSKDDIQFGTLDLPGFNHNIVDWSFGLQPVRFFKLFAGYAYLYGNSDLDISLDSWLFAPSVIDILGAAYHTSLALEYDAHALYLGGLIKANTMNQLQFGAKLLRPSFHGTASYQQIAVGDIIVDFGQRSLQKKVALLSAGANLKTGYKKFGFELCYNKVLPISFSKKDRISNQTFKILNGGDFIYSVVKFYI